MARRQSYLLSGIFLLGIAVGALALLLWRPHDDEGAKIALEGGGVATAAAKPAGEGPPDIAPWAPKLSRVTSELPPGKLRMLYTTKHAARGQLRLRVFPREGVEAVLWETPPGGGIRYYLPSPSYDRVCVLWRAPSSDRKRATVVALGGGSPRDIASDLDVEYALWRSESALAILARTGRAARGFAYTQWQVNVDTKEHRKVASAGDTLAFLRSAFEQPIGLLTALIEQERLGVRLREEHIDPAFRGPSDVLETLMTDRLEGEPLREKYLDVALIKGAGIPYQIPSKIGIPLPDAVAAVSPDGRHVAVTPRVPVVAILVMRVDSRTLIDLVPLTKLFEESTVHVSDICWAPDSKRFTFTEVHYHPAQFYAPDIGPRPDPTDWTNLVRMYTLEDGSAPILVPGSNARLMPAEPEGG